jgi:hypothetical protein
MPSFVSLPYSLPSTLLVALFATFFRLIEIFTYRFSIFDEPKSIHC